MSFLKGQTPQISQVKSAAYTMTAADSGIVTFVDSSAGAVTITLPAVAVGLQSTYTLVAYASSANAINVSPNAVDKIVGLGAAPADDKDRILAAPHIGDYMILSGSDAAGYFISQAVGGWTVQP